MSKIPLLLPTPRYLSLQEGAFSLSDKKLIAVDSVDVQALHFTAKRLRAAIREHADVTWDIIAGTAVPQAQIGAVLSVTPGSTRHVQGYKLTITKQGIHAVASTPAGVFYAVATLIQLLDQYGRDLPVLRITDWPDFPNRGLMLDISRDKVPTMETLYTLVDMLAAWKINQLQLYTEHTFAYQNHPAVWADASPMTGADILALDAYCRQRFIELVPNQNTFGHMSRWLEHERYMPLAEAPEGAQTPWGFFRKGPFSLAPTESESLDLVRDLFDELLPHFSSSQFNVGCDETYDVGQGKSKTAVEEHGVGRVYLDFLLKIYREVKARGRTMQFWGDIIVHHPELVAELPRDVIALEWGYQADHPFDDHGAIFADSGVPYYVCPGTSSWNTLVGRTDNVIGNLRNAAANGLKHGAVGFLNTDWGDRGHWQPLPVSYLGYGYGAAVSWTYEANRDLDIAAAMSHYAFRDATGAMGRLIYDLGNVHQGMGISVFNGNIFFHMLQSSPEELVELKEKYQEDEGFTREKFQQTDAHINRVMAHLPAIEMHRDDAELVQREFSWAANMVRHACQRGLWFLAKTEGKGDSPTDQTLAEEADRLIAEYREIWHARNRPGGFRESVARMERMKTHYQQ